MKINEFKGLVAAELKSLKEDAEIIIKDVPLSVGMKFILNDKTYGDYVNLKEQEVEENGEEVIALVKAHFLEMLSILTYGEDGSEE